MKLGCLLEKKKAFEEGTCGEGFCDCCGWNAEIAEERKQRIRNGEMKVGKDGCKSLKVKRFF